MGRIKDTNKYPIKGSPVANDTVIGNDSEDGGKTVQFYVGNISGESNTVADDNQVNLINFGNADSPVDDELVYIANAINSADLATVEYDEIPVFTGVVYFSAGNPIASYQCTYLIKSKGKGTYGDGGSITVLSTDLVRINKELITAFPDLSGDVNAVVVDLGEIGVTAIEDEVNAADPAIVVGVGENFYFEFTRSGDRYLYGFSGVVGTYGAGYSATDASDYFLVYDPNVPVAITKTSDIPLNDGSDGTSTYVEADELGAVAFSNSYNDLDDLPIISPSTPILQDIFNNEAGDTLTATFTGAYPLSSIDINLDSVGDGYYYFGIANTTASNSVSSLSMYYDVLNLRHRKGNSSDNECNITLQDDNIISTVSVAGNYTNINFETPIAITTLSYPAKSAGSYVLATVEDFSGLEAIDEGNGTAWRLVGADPADYDDPIGFNAVDFSIGNGGGGQTGASGSNSFCAGLYNSAAGLQSVAFGNGNSIDSAAYYGFVMGDNNTLTATGANSAVFGYSNTASQRYALVSGYHAVVSGRAGNAFGNEIEAYSFGETVVGVFSTSYVATGTLTHSPLDRAFNVGIGTGTSARADGFTVLKNGNVSVGKSNFEASDTGSKLQVDGTIESKGYTVATLPAGVTGARAYVTDSTVAASGNFGATVVGGGANVVPVFYDSTNWIIA